MRRHDLLRIKAAAWRGMLDGQPWLTTLPLVAGWVSHDWPVIVRRRLADDPVDCVPAALPLPPRFGKQRISFNFVSGKGVEVRSPVLLRDAARSAPAAWQTVITRLTNLGEETGIVPRVFGALLWEHVTGLSYLTERSDLDLLWAVQDAAAASTLLAGLQRIDADSPVHLDGELELPDGGGVNWHEFSEAAGAGCDEVLVKTLQSVTTRPIEDLFNIEPQL